MILSTFEALDYTDNIFSRRVGKGNVSISITLLAILEIRLWARLRVSYSASVIVLYFVGIVV
jgi:hypothetical protein